jgi:hypothetical protein
MVTDEIKFIKTSKEGVDLQYIQENYPNSIIDVNSNKERNIYIGSERVTDNYNPNVEENSITNNVGGIESGINVSELKGKSISEILDIILFSSNNNMEEYYTKLDVDNKLSNKQDILYAGSNIIIDNNEISVDLTNYAKTEDLSNYALVEDLPNMEEYVSKGEIENVALNSDLNVYA